MSGPRRKPRSPQWPSSETPQADSPVAALHYSAGMTITEDMQAALLKVPATVLRHEVVGAENLVHVTRMKFPTPTGSSRS